jgi:alpha,alpha-trehalose phosphorylase
MLVEQTRRSGIWVAAAQAHRLGDGLAHRGAALEADGLAEVFEAEIAPGDAVWLEKRVAYQAWTHAPGEGDPAALAARAAEAAAEGFDALAARRRAELDAFWETADVRVEGDPDAERALRFNLFHLFQSASRDAASGTAAKGLTGEGYEGHVFWDTEAFVLPALVFLAPDLARRALVFRAGQLEGARETARALNHPRGALYPWRTIAGRECSAHYPSGSAQYHINGAVALAIELYWAATADDRFLIDHGAEVLFETARLWMALGRYSPRRGGRFCFFGVTGPDEYTALVDNNHYTNKIAARHLAFAAATAERLARIAPEDFARLAERLGLGGEETEAWRRAAAAIYLPQDADLGIDAQDEAFLGKPAWPFDLTSEEHRPLLLECHPMTLYRHQICKQADLIQAMAFLGDDVPPARMRANLDYYEAVTTHDSTLSHGPFAIVSARVGLADKALDYFRRNVGVDLEDRHRNAGHGSHMAALASSWLALAVGFAGLSWRGGELGFKPVLPAAWTGARFAIRWRGHRLAIEIGREATTYGWAGPETLTIRHFGEACRLEPGQPLACPNPAAAQAAA